MIGVARWPRFLLPASWGAFLLQAVWLDVPFVRQRGDGCGAACVAMVMQYWHAVSPRPGASAVPSETEILAVLSPGKERGVRASALAEYLGSRGYRTFAFKGVWDDLEQHLRKGRPLIVGLKQAFGSSSFHFVVVAGLDRSPDLVLVNDPARRKLARLERSEFERGWKECENWTLLAVPSDSR